MFASCVLAITTTLVLYKVGFAQYPMVLLVLGVYWLVRDHATLRRRGLLVASFTAYFAWLAWFDVLLALHRAEDVFLWVGAPTFLLGCGLLALIVLAAPPSAEPTTSLPPVVVAPSAAE